MSKVSLFSRPSEDGVKVWHYLDYGSRKNGGRKALSVFTYAKPSNPQQRAHNKEAAALLEVKKSQATLVAQSAGSGYIPTHQFKPNFFDYYSEFVSNNEREGNRSLSCSLASFRKFIGKGHISSGDITENLCERFRQYLLDNLAGETPADYFMRFKRVLKAATKDGYFRVSPANEVKTKAHPSTEKEVLTREEYEKLLLVPCSNHEVKKAVITSMYTGLRWCDVSKLKWGDIRDSVIVIARQSKTGVPIKIPLHPVVQSILGDRGPADSLVFSLPTADGANKVLGKWVASCKINKHITWHCLRHSVSDILIDGNTDLDTVASFLGHKTAKYVLQRYKKRVRGVDVKAASEKLPTF